MDAWTKSGLASGSLAVGLVVLNSVHTYTAGSPTTLSAAKLPALVSGLAAACWYAAVVLMLAGISLRQAKSRPG